jgi:hypothetical protein
MEALSKITVAASEVTAVCDLEFKIPEGRDGRGIRDLAPLKPDGLIRKGDQMFIEAILNEFLVRLFYGWTFTLSAFEEELIRLLSQLIELIIFNVVQAGFFEPLQGAVRRYYDELIFVRHLRSRLE